MLPGQPLSRPVLSELVWSRQPGRSTQPRGTRREPLRSPPSLQETPARVLHRQTPPSRVPPPLEVMGGSGNVPTCLLSAQGSTISFLGSRRAPISGGAQVRWPPPARVQSRRYAPPTPWTTPSWPYTCHVILTRRAQPSSAHALTGKAPHPYRAAQVDEARDASVHATLLSVTRFGSRKC